MSGDLERRYRRVLRLLPGYYRVQWEEDMVAAFLDGWLTGDPEADEYIAKAAAPGWAEVASVAGLAVRLYLGGASAPRRYFARGQAVRHAVLVVILVHAVRAVDGFVRLAWAHRLLGVPAPPASMGAAPAGGIWPTTFYEVGYAWIVVFVLLVLGRYRAARIIAVLAIVPDLVALLQAQSSGSLQTPWGDWAFWLLLDLSPVLAMAAFHRDAPPVARRPWLLALPATYLLVWLPVMVLAATGNSAWIPDFPGTCCILVSLACLAHAPRARSRQAAGPGVWPLTLMMLVVVAGAFRIVSLGDYLHYFPHLIDVGLAELLILVATAALVAPGAGRTQTATPASSGGFPPPEPPAKHEPGTLRPSSVLASALAAIAIAIAITVASYTSHLTPLEPDLAATIPPPRHLGSPIVLQVMLSQPASQTGRCPAGSAAISGPAAQPGLCFRELGAPVTFTSAGVTSYQPRNPPGMPPLPAGTSGLLIALPAADTAALTALTTEASDSQSAVPQGVSQAVTPQDVVPRGFVAINVAGKTWAILETLHPITTDWFSFVLPSKNLALQLQRILVPS
jgi:hypothetical protein